MKQLSGREKLRKFRDYKELSYRQLSAYIKQHTRTSISHTTLHKIETGKTPITSRTGPALAKILGVKHAEWGRLCA